MADATITFDDTTRAVFRSGSNINAGSPKGADVRIRGTQLGFTFTTGNSGVLNVWIDGVAVADVPVTGNAGVQQTVLVASGLADAEHQVRFEHTILMAVPASGLPCLTATGANPTFMKRADLGAGGSSTPIKTWGVWNWGTTWGLLTGALAFRIVGSGYLQLYTRFFTSGGVPLYLDVDGVESNFVPTASIHNFIGQLGSYGDHNIVVRNTSTSSGWGFYGNDPTQFVRVWYYDTDPAPTLAAYNGTKYFGPDDATRVRPAAGTLISNSALNTLAPGDQQVGMVIPGTATSVDFLVEYVNTAKFRARIDGVDGSTVTMTSASKVDWQSLDAGIDALPDGPHDVYLRLVSQVMPKVYAFKVGGPAVATPTAYRPRILFLGDSITRAITAGVTWPDSTNGYAYQLGSTYCNPVNLASSGDRSDQCLVRFNSYASEAAAGRANTSFDCISCFIGTNDVSQHGGTYTTGEAISAANYAPYITAIINRRNTSFPGVPLVFLTIVRRPIGANAPSYNAALASAIASAGGSGAKVYLLDITPMADTAGYWNGDGIHLNQAGWTALAPMAQAAYQSAMTATSGGLARRVRFGGGFASLNGGF